ncbi:winged helix-turn-helix domain-containing protein [Streptomyces sp. UNOC14_S4]|uniref:winged helix-turn-helix domain-containing protein n=1 Tax=Streptomyces sp. UNOC14_S4 TaxID=2872340 RepID=UPI001E5FFCD3|nr:winged helix-turn-helix domain-containing protein [Streptomyces sp. UNOC14_S4]MCC3770760.1 winged helix-turn-helix domain-containing protein [Streptomyces sp. UNOC14_S4]
MFFPTGLLQETVERLIASAPYAAVNAPLHGVAHVMCDALDEPRVRARLTQALTGPDVLLTEMSSRSETPGHALLEAAFATRGPITPALSQLLSLVWLEPAVSDLHWHLDHQSSTVPDDAESPHAPVHRAGGLVLDLERRTVSVDGRPVKPTCMEFELLAYLVTHPRRLHRHEQLMEMAWQRSAADEKRTVDTHVARLRRKLGSRYAAVLTDAGEAGYAFEPSKAAPRSP